MDENKTAFKIALGALVALAVVAALWRVLAYEPNPDRAAVRPGSAARQTVEKAGQNDVSMQPVTEQEALRELLPEENFPRVQTAVAGSPSRGAGVKASRPVVYPQNRASRKEGYPGRSSANGKRYVGTNFYSNSAQPAASHAQTAPAFSGGSPAVSFSSAAAKMQEERAYMLAPYLRPNRKQKEQMDAKWNQLSAAIDRAVLQALTPKSKKEQMLEKYAPKQAGSASATQESGLTGPFAPVVSAIAAQKNDIVKSFAQVFGSSAAREAGDLMDAFSQEVAAAAGARNVSPQQAAQQVKAITKKYQQKMEKLEQKSQYDKFVADRVAQDNKQKEELGALYPDEKAQIAQLIDQTREKDLALATQNLPREEYFNQLAQNNQNLRSGIQKLVAQGGKSAQDFQKWEQGQTQAYLEKLGQLEESGQVQSVARVATPDEKRRTQSEIEVQSKHLKEGIVSAFGEQSLADFEPIFENYERTLQQLDEAKLSPLDRETQKANAIKEANRQLLDQKIRTVEKMNIPDGQKQAVLEELRQAYNAIK